MLLNCFYSSTLIYGLANFLFVNLKSASTFRNGRILCVLCKWNCPFFQNILRRFLIQCIFRAQDNFFFR